MRRHMTRFYTAAFALLIIVGLAACGGSSSSSSSSSSSTRTTAAASANCTPEAGAFRMGIEPWLGYGPWRVAQQQGYFKKNGLDVKITNFTTDDQINSAFAAGKLDGTNIATHTALRFVAAGLPIKAVLLEDFSIKADAVLAGPSISSIADLKGKKVAFEEGTTSDILLSYALSHSGMSKSDIQTVPIPAADAGAAFIAGKVPAAVTYEPYLTSALHQDKNAKLLYTAGKDPGLVSDVFVVSKETLKTKPCQVRKLLESWGQAVDYYNGHTKQAQAIITKSVGAKPGELDTAFAGVKLYGLQQNAATFGSTFANQTIKDVEQAAKDAKILNGSVDTNALIDPSIVKSVASGS